MQKLFNEDTVSGENAFFEDYNRKIRSLQERFPHYRILKDLYELKVALKEATWGRVEAANAFHCTIQNFSRLVTREKIPCIYVNREIRCRLKEHFDKLPVSVRTGKILYDPTDLGDWFMQHAMASVETVVVPLTMLSDHPERLFQAFLAEKAQRLPLMIALHKTKDYANRLSTWECMWHIKPQYRDLIGQWQETLLKYADPIKPIANRAKLPAVPLKLAQRFLPRLLTYSELSVANGYIADTLIGRRIARHLGMMSVKLQDDVETTLLTYGPRVGTNRDAACFEAGLVDVWTARQFVEVFGIDALNTGNWLIPKENAFFWTEKPLEYGGFPDYLQMKTLLALDATIRERKG